MRSRSSPRKSGSSSSRQEVDRLLRDGVVLHDPAEESLRTAERLGALKVLQARVREYVRCANPEDRDFQSCRNRSCPGLIYIEDNLDEPGHDYRCGDCERPVFPFRHGKRRYKELRTKVLPEAVKSYVRAELSKLKSDVRDLADGVYRVEGGQLGVVVCVLDYCGDQRFVTRDWASTNPTCYVAVNGDHVEQRFLQEDWIARITLGQVISGEVNFPDLIGKLAEQGPPASVTKASVPVYSKTVPSIVAESPGAYETPRRFVVEVGPRTVRVEGEEVVAPQAGVRFRVFGILWKQFLHDLSAGLPLDEFKSLKLSEIAKRLEEEKQDSVEDVDAIRKAVNRLQSDVETAVKRKLGLAIGREDIIQTLPWKGYEGGEYGYRINPRTVCARPFQAPSA